jgi:hypothetical protein
MKSRTTHTTPKAISRICLGKIGERSASEERYFAAGETEREGNNVNEDTHQTVSSEFAPLASQALFPIFIYIHMRLLFSPSLDDFNLIRPSVSPPSMALHRAHAPSHAL